MLALIVIFGMTCGCTTTRYVDKVVPVPVPGPVEYQKIPKELLKTHPNVPLPEEPPTYYEIMELWMLDRQSNDALNANIESIEQLE